MIANRWMHVGIRAAAVAGAVFVSNLSLDDASASGGRLARGCEEGEPSAVFRPQKPSLLGREETEGGQLGESVAISSNGMTALVGADEMNSAHGAAWAFGRRGSKWHQLGKQIIGAGELGGYPQFGYSVALSADGTTALIGAPFDDYGKGAVWVFTRSGSSWHQQAKLVATGETGTNPNFGARVALSADGDTALLGAPYDAAYPAGAAWVFTRTRGTWTEQAKLDPAMGELTYPGVFGESVALSSDGNTALVGAPYAENYLGAAWIFERDGSTWSQRRKLTGTGEQGEERFGVGVALSGAGDTALIAGDTERETSGAGWIFTRVGGVWSQEGSKFVPGNGGPLGPAVALSSDGQFAFARTSSEGVTRFAPSNDVWTERESLKATIEGDFGFSIALSSQDNALVVGSPLASGVGAATVYAASPPQISGIAPHNGPQTGGNMVTLSGSGFQEVTAVRFGPVAANYRVNCSTSITAEAPPGSGSVHITVVTEAGGTSAVSRAGTYRFKRPRN